MIKTKKIRWLKFYFKVREELVKIFTPAKFGEYILVKISKDNLKSTSQLLNLLHSIIHVYNSPYSIMGTPTFHNKRPYKVVGYNEIKKNIWKLQKYYETYKGRCALKWEILGRRTSNIH